ncbi:MAG: hypothetical protein MJ247_03965 [Alphaproteobacteria bacterium]|nr:hypothetical protein [Alphaproteobacteria bacterium]
MEDVLLICLWIQGLLIYFTIDIHMNYLKCVRVKDSKKSRKSLEYLFNDEDFE